MAQIEIPKQWRTSVCTVLKTADLRLIQWTQDARQDYEYDFSVHEPVWHYEVYPPIVSFLELDHPTGCRVYMDRPPGETYEFYFSFKSQKAYGKILLRPDFKKIILFSAHLPRKPKLSCE